MVTPRELALWKAHRDLQDVFPNVARGNTRSKNGEWTFEMWLRDNYPKEKTWRDGALAEPQDGWESMQIPPLRDPGIVDVPTTWDTTTFEGSTAVTDRALVFVPTYHQHWATLEQTLEAVENLKGERDVLVVENSTNPAYWERLRQSRFASLPGWTLARLCFPGTRDDQFIENTVKHAKLYEFARTWFLAKGYRDMLIVEHDMLPPPGTLKKLRSHQKGVVLSLYRMPPKYGIVAGRFRFTGKLPYVQREYDIQLVTEDEAVARGLVAVDIGGVGCALLQRHVLERVGFRAYSNSPHHCDVYFGVDCIAAGIQMWLDTSVRVPHLRSLDGNPCTLEDVCQQDEKRGERSYEHPPRDHLARYEWANNVLPKNIGVVDVGCGSGYGSNILSRERAVTGVEVDWIPCLWGRKHYPHVAFWNGDWQDAPVEGHCMDAIVAFESLEHVRDGKAFIAKCWQAMKPDGLLLLSTPRKGTSGSPYHLREYSREELLELVATDFEVTKECWQGPNDDQVREGVNPDAHSWVLALRPRRIPLASIFISYKGKNPKDPDWLKMAVTSALAQTHPNLEVVLVHNGPIPELPQDARLKVWEQARQAMEGEKDMNLGAAEALAHTTGEYVMRLDHDNLFLADTVERRVKWMEAHPDVDMAYSDGDVIGEDGAKIGTFGTQPWSFDRLLQSNFIDSNAAVVKGALYRELSFDPSAWVEDWDCWLRLAMNHNVALMPGSTFQYRKHPWQMTRERTPETATSEAQTREKIKRVLEERRAAGNAGA